MRDCLEALLRLSSNTSLNAVDVFAKSSELTNTLSSVKRSEGKRGIRYNGCVLRFHLCVGSDGETNDDE